jgi:hypothetical protein
MAGMSRLARNDGGFAPARQGETIPATRGDALQLAPARLELDFAARQSRQASSSSDAKSLPHKIIPGRIGVWRLSATPQGKAIQLRARQAPSLVFTN